MTYKELLQQEEWHEKCNAVLQRDKYTCKECGCVGFHSNTIYIADTLEEADRVIDEKVFVGCRFSEIVKQIKSGYLESRKRKETELRPGLTEDKRKDLLLGKIPWKPSQRLEVAQTRKISGYYQYQFLSELIDSQIDPFSRHVEIKVYSKKEYKSLSFRFTECYLYVPTSYGTVGCPFFIMEYEQPITEEFIIDVENEGVNISFDKYSITVDTMRSYCLPKCLNVHHTYYVEGKNPWEYPDDALETLCEDCHQMRHEKPVPCYRSLNMKDVVCHYSRCNRCKGSGYLPQYNHVQHGICFECNGEGVII